MNEYEWIIWLNFDAFGGLREQLFSFELTYFEISFVTKQRIVEVLGIKAM